MELAPPVTMIPVSAEKMTTSETELSLPSRWMPVPVNPLSPGSLPAVMCCPRKQLRMNVSWPPRTATPTDAKCAT
uniref:Uncharacterized protein n=1 Tax=Arundo donax TaxID=35708 RepID=A0A0A9FJX5_ARUDO